MKIAHAGAGCLFLFAFATMALEPEVIRKEREGTPATVSAEAVRALESDWKIKGLSARLQRPGATGQEDVFWELCQLCEAQAAARSDKHVEAVLDWLLFEAALVNQRTILEAASIKLPALAPNIGRKILTQRLRELRANLTADSLTLATAWSDFSHLDKAALNGALKEIAAGAQDHNPVTRIWMAANGLAFEQAGSQKEFADACAALEKDLPTQAQMLVERLVQSMESGGARAVLPLLLARTDSSRDGWNSLQRVHQLLGWTADNRGRDVASDLARTRQWVDANYSTLTWDPRNRYFNSDAAPPGAEQQFDAAKKVLAAYGYRYPAHARDSLAVANVLAGLLKEQPGKSPEAKNALADLLACQIQTNRESWLSSEQTALIAGIDKIEPDVAARIWARALGASFAQLPRTEAIKSFQRFEKDRDRELLARVMNALLSEQTTVYENALQSGDAPTALNATVIRVLAGGKPDYAQLDKLMDKAPDWCGRRGKMTEWSNSMTIDGYAAGLRLLLYLATRDPGGNDGGAVLDPLQYFYILCNWYKWGVMPPEPRGQQIAAANAWLDECQNKLIWLVNKSKFTGFPPPHKAALYGLFAKLPPAFKINANDAMDEDGLRLTALQLMRCVDTVPGAAAEPAFGEVLMQVLALSFAQNKQSDTLDHALLEVAKYPLELATKVAALKYETELERTMARGFFGLRLEQNYKIDPKITAAARAQVLPKIQAKFAAAQKDNSADTLVLALACGYFGGAVDDAAMGELIKKAPATEINKWSDWADAIARTPNKAGLRILVMLMQRDPAYGGGALIRMDRLCGRINMGRNTPASERIADYQNWLRQNEAMLTWDEAAKQYRLPGNEVPADPQKAVRPPKPPEEQF